MSDDKPSRFRFSLRTLLEIIAAVALVLALVFSNTWSGSRYELQIVQPIPSKPEPTAFLLDKQTGQVWVRQGTTSAQWFDSGPRP